MIDWDDAYANMAHVPGSADLPDAWRARSQSFRDAHDRAELDIPYGDHPRERIDLFHPEGSAKGLAVFVHGGYWMRTDKSFWSYCAQGACDAGWIVAMPSYALTPEVRVSDITDQIGRAIETAADRVAGPIRLAGHSAGGHLVSRMRCDDGPLRDDVARRIEHVLSISGVHDLRPLLATAMNDTLHLDAAETARESPALSRPVANTQMTCWVGGGERPEFIRQSHLMANIWLGLGAATRVEVEGDLDHFSILEGLTDADAPLTQAFVGPFTGKTVG